MDGFGGWAGGPAGVPPLLPTGDAGDAGARAPARKRARLPPDACQVPNCVGELQLPYHRKYHVCALHFKAPCLSIDGLYQRFCQKCGRFQPVTEFDDDKRTCRAALETHNARRRKRDNQGQQQSQQQQQAVPRTASRRAPAAGSGAADASTHHAGLPAHALTTLAAGNSGGGGSTNLDGADRPSLMEQDDLLAALTAAVAAAGSGDQSQPRLHVSQSAPQSLEPPPSLGGASDLRHPLSLSQSLSLPPPPVPFIPSRLPQPQLPIRPKAMVGIPPMATDHVLAQQPVPVLLSSPVPNGTGHGASIESLAALQGLVQLLSGSPGGSSVNGELGHHLAASLMGGSTTLQPQATPLQQAMASAAPPLLMQLLAGAGKHHMAAADQPQQQQQQQQEQPQSQQPLPSQEQEAGPGKLSAEAPQMRLAAHAGHAAQSAAAGEQLSHHLSHQLSVPESQRSNGAGPGQCAQSGTVEEDAEACGAKASLAGAGAGPGAPATAAAAAAAAAAATASSLLSGMSAKCQSASDVQHLDAVLKQLQMLLHAHTAKPASAQPRQHQPQLAGVLAAAASSAASAAPGPLAGGSPAGGPSPAANSAAEAGPLAAAGPAAAAGPLAAATPAALAAAAASGLLPQAAGSSSAEALLVALAAACHKHNHGS